MTVTLFTVSTASRVLLFPHNSQYKSTRPVEYDEELLCEDASLDRALSETGTPAPMPLEAILRFTTDHTPRDPTQGFVFGTDPKRCDVILHDSKSGKFPISRRHFAITFNEEYTTIVLRNLSQHGTNLTTSRRIKVMSQCHLLYNSRATVHLEGLDVDLKPIMDENFEQEYKVYMDNIAMMSHNPPDLTHLRLRTSTNATPSVGAITEMYSIDAILGQGSSGVVYRAFHRDTSQVVAIKFFKSPEENFKWERHQRRARKEGQILASLSHQNIINFHGFSPEEDVIKMIMEYAPLGSLGDHHEKQRLVGEDGRSVVYQTLLGLQYLHSKGILHRDLKPGNILVISRSPILVKLSDFGRAAMDMPDCAAIHGTPRYMAPDVYEPPYTNRVDIWSLGVISAELFVGLPQCEFDDRKKWQKLLRDTTSKSSVLVIREFLQGTLHENPGSRLSATQCLELSMMRGPLRGVGIPHTLFPIFMNIPDTAPWPASANETDAQCMQPAIGSPDVQRGAKKARPVRANPQSSNRGRRMETRTRSGRTSIAPVRWVPE